HEPRVSGGVHLVLDRESRRELHALEFAAARAREARERADGAVEVDEDPAPGGGVAPRQLSDPRRDEIEPLEDAPPFPRGVPRGHQGAAGAVPVRVDLRAAYPGVGENASIGVLTVFGVVAEALGEAEFTRRFVAARRV